MKRLTRRGEYVEPLRARQSRKADPHVKFDRENCEGMEFVSGVTRRSVAADTALRLERYFGMSADFWLNLQKQFDLISARQSVGRRIEAEIRPRNAA